MMAHKHKLIIVLAVAIILLLAACVNENTDPWEMNPVTSGSDTTVSDTETDDPSETTGEDGGFWLPPDEF